MSEEGSERLFYSFVFIFYIFVYFILEGSECPIPASRPEHLKYVVTGSPQNVVDYFVSSISVEYFESPPFREKWGGLRTGKIIDKNKSTKNNKYSLRKIGANVLMYNAQREFELVNADLKRV